MEQCIANYQELGNQLWCLLHEAGWSLWGQWSMTPGFRWASAWIEDKTGHIVFEIVASRYDLWDRFEAWRAAQRWLYV